MTVVGNPDMKSEVLVAAEAGFRSRKGETLFLDVSGFYNRYRRLRSVEEGQLRVENDPPPAHLVISTVLGNKMRGKGCGIEAALDWRIGNQWRLKSAYSYLRMALELDATSVDPVSEIAEGQSPRHQLYARGSLDLPGNLIVDLALRYVGDLPAIDVPGYVGVDARLAWHPTDAVELSVLCRNLLERKQLEFRSGFGNPLTSQVQRSVFVDVRFELN